MQAEVPGADWTARRSRAKRSEQGGASRVFGGQRGLADWGPRQALRRERIAFQGRTPPEFERCSQCPERSGQQQRRCPGRALATQHVRPG